MLIDIRRFETNFNYSYFYDSSCMNLYASGVFNPVEPMDLPAGRTPGAKVSLSSRRQPQAVINPAVYKLQH